MDNIVRFEPGSKGSAIDSGRMRDHAEDILRDPDVSVRMQAEADELPSDVFDTLSLQVALGALGLGDLTADEVPDTLVGALRRLAEVRDLGATANTVRARRQDLAAYVSWTRQAYRLPLSEDPEDFAQNIEDYLAFAARRLSPNTLRRRGATLGALGRVLGVDRADLAERRRIAGRAVRAMAARRVRPVAPASLGPRELSAMLTRLESDRALTEGRRLRDSAILRVYRDILGRNFELSALRLRDVDPGDTHGRTPSLFVSSQSGGGAGVWIGISPSTRAAIHAWIEVAGLTQYPEDTPLFRAIARDGHPRRGAVRPLGGQALNDLVQEHAEAAGITAPGGRITAHAIRRGIGRALFERGIPLEDILSTGRWRNEAEFRRYVGLPLARGAELLLLDQEQPAGNEK